MGRGRPRKPRAETTRAAVGTPDQPRFLGEAGQREWNRVTSELERLGILGLIDRAALATYCEAWNEFEVLSDRLQNEPWTCTTPQGTVYQNPLLGIKNKAADRVLKAAAQFGMTPAAREKIAAKGGQGEEDKLRQFLTGGKK